MMEKQAKMEELTQTDRMRVLDLFVNNEKVIAQLFELIFPTKPATTTDAHSPRKAEKPN